MNHQFYPYHQQVIPFPQQGRGDISIYVGTHPYGQGGNGLGGMFRSLFRTATPFLKTTAKKVGKRLLNTGLETGMQIVHNVMNGQPLKAAAKSRNKAAGKSLLTGTIDDITQQGRGKRACKRTVKAKPFSTHPIKKRIRQSRIFFTKYGLSTPSLSPWWEFKLAVVSSTCHRCVNRQQQMVGL